MLDRVETKKLFFNLWLSPCLFMVCVSVWYFAIFLLRVHGYRNRKRGMLKQVAGGTGCAEISSIDLGGFRVARRFAGCACTFL